MNCPVCTKTVDFMPSNPIWDYPYPNGVTTTGDILTMGTAMASTQPVPETKGTYKCVNPKCWVTKIRVEWE